MARRWMSVTRDLLRYKGGVDVAVTQARRSAPTSEAYTAGRKKLAFKR